jgi:hypothetical protein
MVAVLHDDVAALAFLLGTWSGEGRGGYPTVDPFTYREELSFEHVGEPFLLYRQESWSPEGEPVHFERGFLRPEGGDGSLELSLAHSSGRTEVSRGTLDRTTVELTAGEGDVGRTADGVEVRGLQRRYRVDGDTMTYVVEMQTSGTPMTMHLEATLRRTS